jgi:hypothetical protein
VPQTAARRTAAALAGMLPAAMTGPLRRRLVSGGMYADEDYIRALAAPAFVIETMDRFTSEAHLHVRAVLQKSDGR